MAKTTHAQMMAGLDQAFAKFLLSTVEARVKEERDIMLAEANVGLANAEDHMEELGSQYHKYTRANIKRTIVAEANVAFTRENKHLQATAPEMYKKKVAAFKQAIEDYKQGPKYTPKPEKEVVVVEKPTPAVVPSECLASQPSSSSKDTAPVEPSVVTRRAELGLPDEVEDDWDAAEDFALELAKSKNGMELVLRNLGNKIIGPQQALDSIRSLHAEAKVVHSVCSGNDLMKADGYDRVFQDYMETYSQALDTISSIAERNQVPLHTKREPHTPTNEEIKKSMWNLYKGNRRVRHGKEPIQVGQVDNHSVLGGVRTLYHAETLTRCVKDAFATATQLKVPTTVWAVGASVPCATGFESADILQRRSGDGDVCYFANIPLVREAEGDTIRRRVACRGWNYVPARCVLIPGAINYCHHATRDCDCLKYRPTRQEHVYAFSVHSLYDMDSRDYKAARKFTRGISAVVNIKHVGQDLPLENPEFTVLDGTEHGGFFQRLAAKARVMLTGNRDLVTVPLHDGGTFYRNADINSIIANGGFHTTKASEFVDTIVEKPLRNLAIGALTAATTTFLQTPGDAVTRSLTAAASAVMSPILLTAACRIEHSMRLTQSPGFFTNATIAVVNEGALTNATDKEPISTMLTVAFPAGPATLNPQPLHNIVSDPEGAKRGAATCLMAKDRNVAMGQTAASLLRDGKPVHIVAGTLRNVAATASFLDRCIKATGLPGYCTLNPAQDTSQRYVWAPLLAGSLTLLAASCILPTPLLALALLPGNYMQRLLGIVTLSSLVCVVWLAHHLGQQ